MAGAFRPVKPAPACVADFLRGKRLAVAGVSRNRGQAANAVFRKLRDSGFEVYPINPRAGTVEGVACFSNLAAVPGPVHGVVVATHPDVASEIVRQCAACGVRHVWFHRSFGRGSASAGAVRECEARGLNAIVGGCPLMFCEPVDPAHRCLRWWLAWRGRVPR